MWSALLHFIPVLTRSGGPALGLRLLPLLAFLAAGLLLTVFAGALLRHVLLASALAVGVGSAVLLGWSLRRVGRAIGKPHPGVYWYVAALACLLAGLAAAFGIVLDVARYPLWYGFHLHVNLLGWIGLTVLGTLPVLLPTNLQKFDPNATFRLQLGLPWAISGVIAIALAAALRQPILGTFGALGLMLLIGAHWRAWFRLYGAPWRWPGPGQSLFLGSGFLFLLLSAGLAHGFGLLSGAAMLPAFAAGFLLSTVLGALAQLLPVWRFPGADSAARRAMACALAHGAGVRGGLCVLAGLGQLFNLAAAMAFAGLAVLWLLLAVLWSTRRQSR